MIVVSDVLPDVQRVLGGVDRETGLARLNDAIEILATETDWDPLRGYMDIIVTNDGRITQGAEGKVITLPREIGTVTAVNICGRPTQGHGFWFQFHLNGPGSGCGSPCGWHWHDDIPVAVYQDPSSDGDYLAASLETADDNDTLLRVYGYDVNENWIRTPNTVSGLLEDGFLVPTTFGSSVKNPDAPLIRRITRVSLGDHVGRITLNILNSDNSLTPIGQYYEGDTEPQYRRIKVGVGTHADQDRVCVRVSFKKTVVSVSEDRDLIPLHSKYAIVMMVKSLSKIDSDRIIEAGQYHSMAIAYLVKKQESLDVPGGPGIQIADNNLIADKFDRMN